MYKNVASQKLLVYAFDSTTNLPKTGDAANITAYVSKDYGSVTVLGDTSATEADATNGKGYYLFDVTQTETNADTLLFSAKSSTANIVVLGMPAVVFTRPPNFSKGVIDSAGLFDANAVKIGPTGAGTAQTAGDVGIKTGFRLSSTGVDDILRTALTESYNADGAAPTLSQALFLLLSFLMEANISSTTITCKKLDGSTNAATFTISDATNPVTITRAT